MKNLARLSYTIGVLFLLMLFVYPMWRITLEAPQYPDGITMFIWIDDITGDEPGTVQNINILNHYVGMKYITVDTFPELTYFKYIVIALIISGLIVAFSANRKLYLLWLAILIILGILGIYDFYLWEYAYGHDLDPKAPIQIPGQAYQPPLFGKKELLNFVAISYPALGGISIGIADFFAFLGWWLLGQAEKKKRR